VVYGAAKGRCAGLNIGRVVEEKNGGFKVAAVQVSFGRYFVTGKDHWADKNAKPRKRPDGEWRS